MALFRRDTAMERFQAQARRRGKAMNARAKQFSYTARARGQQMAAGANRAMARTQDYVRRNPKKTVGVLAALAGLIGLGLRSWRRR